MVQRDVSPGLASMVEIRRFFLVAARSLDDVIPPVLPDSRPEEGEVARIYRETLPSAKAKLACGGKVERFLETLQMFHLVEHRVEHQHLGAAVHDLSQGFGAAGRAAPN